MSLDDLAGAAGLRPHVVRRMEQGDPRTTIRTVESCLVALEARGVRFRYGGEVTKPSYTVTGMKVRRPSRSRKIQGNSQEKPSYLPVGMKGRCERTSWGFRIVHGV